MTLEKSKTEYSKIKKIISEFNKEIQAMETYEERRLVKTTPTIFYDTPLDNTINLEISPENWCTIPENLANFLTNEKSNKNIICYEGKDEVKLIENTEFLEKCKNKLKKYLLLMSEVYLKMKLNLTEYFEEKTKNRMQEKISQLKIDLQTNPDDFLDKKSIIQFINKEIHYSKTEKLPKEKIDKKRNKSIEIIEKVKNLRQNPNYSVKSICKICKISQSKFYDILKRINLGTDKNPIIRGRPPINRTLTHEQILYIKELADSPENSFTVPDICFKLYEKFGIEISKKTVYYYLTKVLNYSYKRNHFKNPVAFSPQQNIVKFKTCRKYLKFLLSGKTILNLDESGYFVSEKSEYGWSPKNHPAFRVCHNSFKKLNVIAAITDKKVFAYTIRSSNHNLHSFLAFTINAY